MPHTFPKMVPVFVCGLLAHHLAGRLLHGLATSDELQTVLRGLPHNPTTEMDIALWKLTRLMQADPAITRYLLETSLKQQSIDYKERRDPAGVPPTTIKGVPEIVWSSRRGRNRSWLTPMVRRSNLYSQCCSKLSPATRSEHGARYPVPTRRTESREEW